MDQPDDNQPVGVLDIADRLNVNRTTVYTWLRRDDFPKPRQHVNRTTPIWAWGRIRLWHENRRSADV